MKKGTVLLLFFISITANAQDALKTELFDVDLIMKHQTAIQLTEAQKTTIKKVHEAHISKFNSTKWDLAAEMSKLNSQLSNVTIDENVTLQKMETINKLESQLKITRLAMLIKVKNQLSEVQQTTLKSLRTESDLSPASLVTSMNDGQQIKLQIGKRVDSKDTPLYILKDKNGEREIKESSMQSINPNTIESVSVLKGESATSLYGHKGTNGVVVIKLKKQF